MQDFKAQNIIESIKKIKHNIELVCTKCNRNPDEITLLAATKTVSPEYINVALENGIRTIGENRVQEYISKKDALNEHNFHFIGKLQTNKVKYIVGTAGLIHSVDNVKLATEISKRAKRQNIVQEILLEVNVGEENSKSGILVENFKEISQEIFTIENLKIRGVMAIPPFYDEKDVKLRKNFSKIYDFLLDLQAKKSDNSIINIASFGMSHDYMTAIEYGATIIRVGSAIFGERN